MQLLFLVPFLILFLSGCNVNKEPKIIDESKTNENIQFKEDRVLDYSIIDGKIEGLKTNTEEINLDKTKIEELINSEAKSPLDIIDECIDSNEKKGLPIYECSKLLKP